MRNILFKDLFATINTYKNRSKLENTSIFLTLNYFAINKT